MVAYEVKQFELGQMADLDLGDNAFEELPDTLWNIRSLRSLWISRNRITELPPAVGKFAPLALLHASNNAILTLPREMAQLTNLFVLDLEGNPLQDPLPALLEAGIPELFSYLRSLDDARPQYEAKLLLVGEGEVGKSSLIAALDDREFLEGRDSTHDICRAPA